MRIKKTRRILGPKTQPSQRRPKSTALSGSWIFCFHVLAAQLPSGSIDTPVVCGPHSTRQKDCPRFGNPNGFSEKISKQVHFYFFRSDRKRTTNGTERRPFGSRTDPERTPYGPRTDPVRPSNGPRADPARTPRGPRANPARTPNGLRTGPERTPNGPRTDPGATKSSPKNH